MNDWKEILIKQEMKEEKIKDFVMRMDNREYESHYLIDWAIGSRRKTWDQEYNNSEYSQVFETKFVLDNEEIFVLVGMNFD